MKKKERREVDPGTVVRQRVMDVKKERTKRNKHNRDENVREQLSDALRKSTSEVKTYGTELQKRVL